MITKNGFPGFIGTLGAFAVVGVFTNNDYIGLTIQGLETCLPHAGFVVENTNKGGKWPQRSQIFMCRRYIWWVAMTAKNGFPRSIGTPGAFAVVGVFTNNDYIGLTIQ